MNESLTNVFGPVIHSYSRAQAIGDGVLHDVTDISRDYGILLPTAIASHAWSSAVAWPNRETASRYETERTRTVLAHARNALLRAKRLGLRGLQEFAFTPTPGVDGETSEITLGIEIGPGDAAEPVLTITAAADR